MVENPWMYDHVTRSTSSLKTIVRYAPPGVDTALFHPRETPAAPEPYILSVGRFSDPRKNVLLLLEAYALLAHSLASAPRLVLAGTGDPGERFWSQAAKLGVRDRIAFHLMPTSDEVAVLFRSATCFALASDEEGFGIVVAEALASGLPVVSTRSGGPEGIISDGVDGYLVARDDAAQMADRLERLLRDPVGAAAMGKMGRAKVEKRFEDRVAGNVYLDVYRELLSRQC